MKNKILFIVSRIKNASFLELIYRIKEFFLLFRLKKKVHLDLDFSPVPCIENRVMNLIVMPTCKVGITESTIDDYLHGFKTCLNADLKKIEEFETRSRRTYFSDVWQGQGDPDIRTVWEPARLQHVAALISYALTRPDSEITVQCRKQAKACVLEWIGEHPFLYGPHYKSAMECGLRVPVFFTAVQCLAYDEREFASIFSAIYHHTWWIEKRLSIYSSLGNHTVCECVGLVFGGAIFKDSPEGKRWLERGVELLRQELEHQILLDGGPAEQSLSYHRFVLDLYWLAVDFLETNGLNDCSGWRPRLEAGERFLAAFTDERGMFPAIGDSDDGHAIGPGLAPRRFEPGPCSVGVTTFPESGYTIVRRQTGLLLTVDHGPLGMAPLYNHGHADALSFTLGVRGVPFFIDPGTYRYNGVPRHRQYFKGTPAHNTVTVDGQDQARQLTSFIWDKPYASGATVREEGGATRIEAWNDGYERLASPVRHSRTFLVAEDGLRISDVFSGRGRHVFELHLHLHPEVRVEREGNSLVVERGGVTLDVRFEGVASLEVVRGQEEPLLGWYSPAYGLLEPTTTIRLRQDGLAGDIRFETSIQLRSPR